MLDARHIPLRTGQTYRVLSLGGDQRIADRLIQMGILPGIEFTIVRIGPMGNPLELAIAGGQSIALRNTDVLALDRELLSLPLSAAPPGIQHYQILALPGHPRARQKLEGLGLHLNSQVRVEATRPYQVRLLEEDRSIRLGQTEAQTLILQPVANNG
jgi:ferrous iron transport protein A